jgi:hypothetical protein
MTNQNESDSSIEEYSPNADEFAEADYMGDTNEFNVKSDTIPMSIKNTSQELRQMSSPDITKPDALHIVS